MKSIIKKATTDSKTVESSRLVEVTVEQLTVYRYHVPADVADPEGVAMARFLVGEKPDAGSADGEQHDLTTCFVGDVDPIPPADFDAWAKTYRPVRNGHRPDAPFDGLMFETFGDELETILAATPGCVWTLVEGDDDTVVVVSGFHVVNRLGYFLTEFRWVGSEIVEIPLD
ncbi:hypothetical protein [Pacificispira sp.]|uniref:hypothetical protein n=1 Tax=Pacificispira sp. TaxID=2888761 RepID=UPI003B52FB4B